MSTSLSGQYRVRHKTKIKITGKETMKKLNNSEMVKLIKPYINGVRKLKHDEDENVDQQICAVTNQICKTNKLIRI